MSMSKRGIVAVTVYRTNFEKSYLRLPIKPTSKNHCGWFFTRLPRYTHVYSNPSLFLTKLFLFSLRVTALFFQFSLQNCQPPSSSFSSLIYSSRLVEGLWLFLVISGHGGPIPLPLSGCLVGSRSRGFGTDSHLKRNILQRYSLEQYRAAET